MITIEQVLSDDEIGRCYEMYRAAFEPVQLQAAARHLFTYDEIAEEMRDARIDKYVARGEQGEIVGLAAMTTDLSALPWIEPKFLASRHPDQASSRKVFYLGYVLVDPDGAGFRVFKTLGDAFLQTVADARGVLAWDVCAYNDKRAVGRMAASLPRRFGAHVQVVDTQTYYTADFAPPAPAPAEPQATRAAQAGPAAAGHPAVARASGTGGT